MGVVLLVLFLMLGRPKSRFHIVGHETGCLKYLETISNVFRHYLPSDQIV